ncbi:phosphatidate cytidylyltransferase [Hydrogenivirga sp. 128-5-R1-1]|uniref:phosphatidate cytidylyltransferase n=1 Tax=Hydrogenivirga sp. 128-5-R1-1 TaxID=392423 RepID=UPI00015EF2AD|nr:phosphatidate cytidylyltransferase [Hydrogenivirga sp. 128-5-R1-1]EDP74149.1 phosphatidate cytidylyltransferase [Hydrogenivirga sp. 128-5-R1-1]
MSKLLVRTISGIILASIAISAVLFLDKNIFKFFIAVLSAVAVWETANLLTKKFEKINPISTAIIGFLASLSILFFNFYLAVLTIFLYGFYEAVKKWDINYLTSIVFSLIYGSFFVSSLGLLVDEDKYLLLILFATVWAGDTFAYFVGKTFGKNKLAPRLSPKKTLEGAFGSILGSLIAGGITAYYFNHLEAIVPTAIASIVMQIGDLFESFLKRQVGVKDSSNLIPGHGGILDRIDALMFASIVFLTFYNFL